MNEDEAASKIQASFKGYKTRKDLNVKKQQVRDDIDRQEREKEEREAAVTIQSSFKGYKARKEFNEMRDRKKVEIEAEPVKTDINDNEKGTDDKARAEAAVKIQSSYRGYKTRKEYHGMKQKKAANDKSKIDNETDTDQSNSKTLSEDEAASRIQAGFKGYKTRKELTNKPKVQQQQNKADSEKELDAAASTIQANFKGYKVRKEYDQNKQKQKQEKAATKIQASYRGYQTRKDLKKKKEEPQMPDQSPSPKPDTGEDLNKAATTIQSGFRGYKARKEFKAKVIGDEIVETDPDQLPESICTQLLAEKSQFSHDTRYQAATDFQKVCRMYISKKMSRMLEEADKNCKVTDRRHVAATQIQSHFRGYCVRKQKFYSVRAVNDFQAVIRAYLVRKTHDRSGKNMRLMSVQNGGHYASVIQSLCRGYITRRIRGIKFSSLKSSLKWTAASHSENKSLETKTFWEDSNVKMYSDKTLRKSAARIQAAIYAYKIRKNFKQRRERLQKKVESVILQACFRGYRVRKLVKEQMRRMAEQCEKGVGENDEIEKQLKNEMEAQQCEKDVAQNDEIEKQLKNEMEDHSEHHSDHVNRAAEKENLCMENVDERNCLEVRDDPNEDRIEINENRNKTGCEEPNSVTNSTYVADDKITIDLDVGVSLTAADFGNEGTVRSLTELSQYTKSGSISQSVSICLSDKESEGRKGSAKSMSTWKSVERVKAVSAEIEKEGDSLKEVEDDVGEMNSIERNNAVNHLQAAFRACQLRKELRREMSEIRGGGEELVDIQKVRREVSLLRKDFKLNSRKVRRLGSYQFGNMKSPLWSKSDKNEDAKHSNSSSFLISETEKQIKLNAKEKIVAAFRGYRTRKTEALILRNKRTSGTLQSTNNGTLENDDTTNEQNSDGKKSDRTVFHVKMHSDVIEERATTLQAAFSGYQTRKVFISLTKFVQQSREGSHEFQLTRIGSLSETDDFKLRHKSIAKIQAVYESYKSSNEAMRTTQVIPPANLSVLRLPTENSLPEIEASPTKIEIMSAVGERPVSVMTVEGHSDTLPISYPKESTVPELTGKANREEREHTGIEIYIQKKMAATRVQASARSLITRQKLNNNCLPTVAQPVTGFCRLPDRCNSDPEPDIALPKPNISLAKPNKHFPEPNTPLSSLRGNSSKSDSRNTSDKPSPGNKMVNSVNQEQTSEDRSSPTSVKSKSSKVSFKSVHSKERLNKAKEEMTEMMRNRTASIKLEAERRKLIAEEMRQKQQLSKSQDHATTVHSDPAETEDGGEALVIGSSESEVTSNGTSQSDNDKEKMKAVVIIQKVFRGYRSRKTLVEKQRLKKQLENEYKDWKLKRVEAAVAIQSVWRGYLVRKELQDRAESVEFNGFPEPPGMIVINIGRSKSEIERANRRYDNASMIQMVFRASRSRRKQVIKSAYRRQFKERAASKIQAMYAGHMTRKYFKNIMCATRIQSICKAFLVRRIQVERDREKETIRQMSATCLQATYHSFRRRRQNEAEKEARRRNKAVVDIQSCIRGHIIRWDLSKKREAIQHTAANKIKASFMGYKARKERRNTLRAIGVIMAGFRSYQVRHKIWQHKENLEMERKCASKIQAFCQGCLVRGRNKRYKGKCQRENRAASKIQSHIKAKKTRMERKEIKQKRERATLKIQSVYRGHIGRRMVKKQRLELQRESSALKIQSVYRGHVGRKTARKERHKKEISNIAVSIVELLVNKSVDNVCNRDGSAERIQAAVKGYHTRLQMGKKLSDDAKLRAKEKMSSASVIQRVVRAKQLRDLQRKHRMMVEQNKAALKVQSLYKGYRVRKALKEERDMIANLEPPENLMISARTNSGKLLKIPVDELLMKNSRAIILFHRKATELQDSFRAYKTRREMKTRLLRKSYIFQRTPRRKSSGKFYLFVVAERRKIWNRAATVLQAVFKGYWVRKQQRKEGEVCRKFGIDESRRMKYEAANVISSAYRSYMYRKNKRALRVEM